MLEKVTIRDIQRAPLKYLSYASLSAFENGKEYMFDRGLNVIVGPNGSGKTTLLKLISTYTLCESAFMSTIPPILKLDRMLYDDKGIGEGYVMKDGVDVIHDYKTKVFNLIHPKDLPQGTISDDMNMTKLYISTTNISTGEGVLQSFGYLVDLMNTTKNPSFPIEDLKMEIRARDGIWRDKLEDLLRYYERNAIGNYSGQYTVLLDEPDRNLDIMNIKSIYDILMYDREDLQLIAVVHNPILIYKLLKQRARRINWVELVPGYVNEVKMAIESLL